MRMLDAIFSRQGTTHLWLRCPNNRNDVVSLGKDPSKGYLPGGRAMFFSNLLEAVCDLEDVGEVLLRETGDRLAEVAFLKLIR